MKILKSISFKALTKKNVGIQSDNLIQKRNATKSVAHRNDNNTAWNSVVFSPQYDTTTEADTRNHRSENQTSRNHL